MSATKAPLLVLENVEAFLDERGLGSGPLRASRIGEGGGSNFSFLIERDDTRFVLRRPPRPPLPPSAHDMVREARLQLALAKQGIRVPPIVAVCDDPEVLGVPFYVMEHLDGDVIGDELPPRLAADAEARRRLGLDLVDTLAEIHRALRPHKRGAESLFTSRARRAHSVLLPRTSSPIRRCENG